MNLKKFNIIISLLSFNLKVHSVPFNKNKVSSKLKRRNLSFNISENVNDIADILEEKVYDTLPDDGIDVSINVTNNIADEEIDIYSDVVEQIDTNECTSQECIEISKRILNSLDTSVNPCDDFYEFSCGGWIEMNKNKQSYYDSFAELQDKTAIDLQEILEGSYHANDKLSQKEKEYDEELFNATKNFYSSCINSYNTINTNNEILINYINKFNITKALNNADDLAILFEELNEIGINTLFRIEVYDKDFPYKIIPSLEYDLSQNDLPLIEAFLEIKYSKDKLSLDRYFRDENEYDEYIKEQNKIINNYKEFVKKVLSIIYGSNENKIDSMLKSIIGVQNKLSQISIDAMRISPPGPIEFIGTIDYDYNMEIETTSNYDDDYLDDEYEYTQELIDEYTDDSEYNENEEFSSNDLIISIKNFNEKYPLINWKLYFEKVLEKYGIAITDESLISEEHDFKYVYEFFKETDKKDITNFLEWNIINHFLDISTQFSAFKNIISDELYQVKKEYEKGKEDNNDEEDISTQFSAFKNIISDELYQVKKEYEKGKEDNNDEEERPIFEGDNPNSKCLNLIHEYMPFALNKYYIEMKFPENIKPEAMDMIENIRNSMIDRIKKLEWLDESTREHAIEKVLKIKYSIGYSDYAMNVENIYNLYKSLFITKNDILSLLIRITRSENKKIYDLFYNENYNETQLNIYIFEQFIKTYIVNALYDSGENIMIFPAAILQSPKYDVNQPDYINYGNIGSVMGHELTHAFDSNGKNYDANGKKNNWWTDNDNEEFNEFSQCYIDQYNNLSIEIKGKKYYIDGESTLDENLADNSGLDRAYESWKSSIENNPEKAKKRNMILPGLSDYTIEQLFYISYAHGYCTLEDGKYIKDIHSPNKIRTNGVISNNKHFAKVFNCPTGSLMNPEHKCTLW